VPSLPDPQVFLSYRRNTGSDFARLLKDRLESGGFEVFLDVDDLGTTQYAERLLEAIGKVQSVVVVLSPGSLNRVQDPDDLFTTEIAEALAAGKHIIPVSLPGFEMPSRPSGLPKPIRNLLRINVIEYNRTFWSESLALIEAALDHRGTIAQSDENLSLLPRVGHPDIRFDSLLQPWESRALFVAWPIATLAIAALAIVVAYFGGNLFALSAQSAAGGVRPTPLLADPGYWVDLSASLAFMAAVFAARARLPATVRSLFYLDSPQTRALRWHAHSRYNNKMAAYLAACLT
jgi:hypothetical protein